MKTFKAPYIPDDPAALPGFLRQLASEIEQSANRADPYMELQVLAAAPKRLRNGMLVEADGANWNPGSGAGLYVYRAGAWVFIG